MAQLEDHTIALASFIVVNKVFVCLCWCLWCATDNMLSFVFYILLCEGLLFSQEMSVRRTLTLGFECMFFCMMCKWTISILEVVERADMVNVLQGIMRRQAHMGNLLSYWPLEVVSAWTALHIFPSLSLVRITLKLHHRQGIEFSWRLFMIKFLLWVPSFEQEKRIGLYFLGKSEIPGEGKVVGETEHGFSCFHFGTEWYM